MPNTLDIKTTTDTEIAYTYKEDFLKEFELKFKSPTKSERQIEIIFNDLK